MHRCLLLFRVSPSYISRIMKLVFKLRSENLPAIFLPIPIWENLIAAGKEFEKKWNFPNCFAIVDGKHVRIFCPGKTGLLYLNYKDFFSIVLLAFVDAIYNFMMVDIGSYGKEGDSGIIEKFNIESLPRNEEFYSPPRQLTEDVWGPYMITGMLLSNWECTR